MKNLISRNLALLSVVSLLLVTACSDEDTVLPIADTNNVSTAKFKSTSNARSASFPAELQSTAAFCTYSGCTTTFGPSSFWVPLEAIATFATPLAESDLDLSRAPFEYYDQASLEWFVKGKNESDFRLVYTDETGSVGRSRTVRQARTEVKYTGGLYLMSINLAPGTYEVLARYTMNGQVAEDLSEIEIIAND